LYNVRDATRPTLLQKLRYRTLSFHSVSRSPGDIEKYETLIRSAEADTALDEDIHVCEFAGFVDNHFRSVGCMLHPSAPGNRSTDLRGLCHYGSMACKTFYCPAWKEIPAHYRDIVVRAIDDWHLYGLVITDVDFVMSLFGALEDCLGTRVNPEVLSAGEALGLFREILAWKDSWPFKESSTLRRSRYYCSGAHPFAGRDRESQIRLLLNSLRQTFDIRDSGGQEEDLLTQAVENLAAGYDGHAKSSTNALSKE